MNATLMAFAVNPLIGTEMLLGFPVPKADAVAYLAVWRYLGWLLGVPVNDDNAELNVVSTSSDNDDDNNSKETKLRPLDPCGPGWISEKPDPLQHAYAMFQSVILHLLEPDQSSVKIANHLLWQGRVKDAKPAERAEEERWYYFRSLQCRRFVGDPLADALQLPLRSTWWGKCKQYLVSNSYLLILTAYSWLGLPWSPFRSWLVQWHRGQLHKMNDFLESGHRERVNKTLGGDSVQDVCPFAMISPPIH